MKREELIKKWLDNELSSEEFKLFHKLDDADELMKLSESIKAFQIPSFNSDSTFEKINQSINPTKFRSKNSWTIQFLRIAAIVVIGMGIYTYIGSLDTRISTSIAEKTSVILPDASHVLINSKTDVSFNKNNWGNNRDIKLEGEAYFKVSKGAKFNVRTSKGTITVLGTEFNVKHRDGLFEVMCYEGSVNVNCNDTDQLLMSGDSFLLLNGEIIATDKENLKSPAWKNNQSYFKSMPLIFVFREFERQYKVILDYQLIDTSQKFTGSFDHDDLDLALKSITLPLNIKFEKLKQSKIILSSE